MPTCESAAWQRHRPEHTVLYRIVRERLPAFLRHAEEHYAGSLPKFVRLAFERYLQCGLLEHGFLRVHCDACKTDRLVAFSCKQRGVCPSCAARIMCNQAAHLTDRVLPNVPIRQWVLSLPFQLRRLAARDPQLLAACSRIFVDAIFRWMSRATGLAGARGGALTFVQRFGSSLNLHVHFHVLVIDGVFTRASPDALPTFHPAPTPTPFDLNLIVRKVRDRIMRWLEARSVRCEASEGADRARETLGSTDPPSALDACTDLALQRGIFAELRDEARAGQAALSGPVDDAFEHARSRKSASYDGFNLHAAVRVGADDDSSREKLIRYCARPAFALERLNVLPDGRIAYAIKNARRGATHRILTPIELLARIAALIPPPFHPFLRYHGVLAPASKWRKHIVPRPQTDPGPPTQHRCDGSGYCERSHGDSATDTGGGTRTAIPGTLDRNGPRASASPRDADVEEPSRKDTHPERDPRTITPQHCRRTSTGGSSPPNHVSTGRSSFAAPTSSTCSSARAAAARPASSPRSPTRPPSAPSSTTSANLPPAPRPAAPTSPTSTSISSAPHTWATTTTTAKRHQRPRRVVPHPPLPRRSST